jgi:lysophospholipid acyltransferase (LPLAT)-like uncharacterized protein
MDDRPDRSVIDPRNGRGWLSSLRRRFVRSNFAYAFLSSVAVAYLRLVRATSRTVLVRESPAVLFTRHGPLIGTAWHGEAFLLPVLRPSGHAIDVMVSRAGDGEIISRSLRKFGFGTVRGSGATNPARMFEKGSVAAFRGLKASLDDGHSVLLTADFDARSHGTVSAGVIALARLSQRPIVPMVAVSSRRRRMRSWDQTALALPFGRIVVHYGDPVMVPRRASESELEAKRLEVEGALKAITEQAYAIADKHRG